MNDVTGRHFLSFSVVPPGNQLISIDHNFANYKS